jgi:hypothetical protein
MEDSMSKAFLKKSDVLFASLFLLAVCAALALGTQIPHSKSAGVRSKPASLASVSPQAALPSRTAPLAAPGAEEFDYTFVFPLTPSDR